MVEWVFSGWKEPVDRAAQRSAAPRRAAGEGQPLVR